MKRTKIIVTCALITAVYLSLTLNIIGLDRGNFRSYNEIIKEYNRLKLMVADFQLHSNALKVESLDGPGAMVNSAETQASQLKIIEMQSTTATTITTQSAITTTTTTVKPVMITTSTNLPSSLIVTSTSKDDTVTTIGTSSKDYTIITTTSKDDTICEMDHQDEEREYLLSLPSQERRNLKLRQQQKVQEKSSDLSDEEFKKLIDLDMMDSLKPEPIKCEDNLKRFNATVFAKLNLFYITLNEELLPVLTRNESCFKLIELHFDDIKCTYSYIDSDEKVKDGKKNIALAENTIRLESPYNGVGVTCTSQVSKISHLLRPSFLVNSTTGPQDSIQFYEDIFMYTYKTKEGFQQMKNVAALSSSPAYSVMILCLDSTSKSAFLRNMPLTTSYLEQQGAVRFNHHHRQGENSYPNVIPLLSGRRVIYEENAKDGFDKGLMDNIAATNNMSWAWEPWAKVGLPTMHHEDMAWAGVYNYHYKKGWNKRPFMFYHHSVYDAMVDWKIRNKELMNHCYLCINNSPVHQRQLSLLSNFMRSFHPVPHVSLTHFAEYSHDHNNFISYMDKDLQMFLKKHFEEGFFDRTLLILMGDHGRRGGGAFTRSRAGWVDVNTPLLFLRPPPELKLQNPDITRILKQNKDKITTMQDLFKTITDPIITRVTKPLNDGLPREQEGLSLLQPLPPRTCEEALVPDEFCTCPQEKTNININDPAMIEYAKQIVNKVMEMSKGFDKCQHLSLHHIEWGWGSKTIYHFQIVTYLTASNMPKYNSSTDSVSCGNHKAAFCSLCPKGHGAAYCNGDCTWINGKCRIKPVSVNCGAHYEKTCSRCPKGRGKNYCNGDCKWEDEKKECILSKVSDDEHYDDLPTFHAVFDVKTWPKVEIRRSDWYSTTSSCVTDDSLDSIRPFCICPR